MMFWNWSYFQSRGCVRVERFVIENILSYFHIFITSPSWSILWMKGLGQGLSERGSKKGALKAVKSCRKKAKINNISCRARETHKNQLKWNRFKPKTMFNESENITKPDLICSIVLIWNGGNQNIVQRDIFPDFI